ncbi:MAG: hypothetical protein J1E97_06835 [Muribaculaceae bacterium]|nr:hypothetical protein [Muribaculaceae bacterium]
MKEEKEFKISYLAAHATTIISVTLVLLLVGIIAMISIGARRETRNIRESVEISVITEDAVSDAGAQALLDTIRRYPFVKESRLVTRAQALEQWKADTGEDLEAVFGVNPLSPEIEFTLPEAYSNQDSIKSVVAEIGTLAGVAEVATPDADMLRAMNRNIEAMSVVMGVIAFVMLIISYVLISNTVRLTIYSRRFTIHTMQLVGATGGFISRPVVLNNMLAGVIAGLVASGILAVALAAAPHYVGVDFGSFIGWPDYVCIAGGLVAGGALICGIAAWIATRRYLSKDYSELFK